MVIHIHEWIAISPDKHWEGFSLAAGEDTL